jgi:hypothetical protein
METDLPELIRPTILELRERVEPAAQIARSAGVPESWLRMFMRGKIPNPGVRQFSRVRAYLDGHPKAA